MEARSKDIVEDMVTSMYIPGFLCSATSHSTCHMYASVTKLFQLWKEVLVLPCSLSDAKYSKDDVNVHLGLVHLESLTLFLQDELTKMLYLKDAERNNNNTHRRGSFPTKGFYTESVALLTDMEKVRTVLNAKVPEKNITPESFLDVPILRNLGHREGGFVPIGNLFFNKILVLSQE